MFVASWQVDPVADLKIKQCPEKDNIFNPFKTQKQLINQIKRSMLQNETCWRDRHTWYCKYVTLFPDAQSADERKDNTKKQN